MPSYSGRSRTRMLRRIQRQAFAGLLWSKQFFHYDVTQWLEGDPVQPAPPRSRLTGRNAEWVHTIMARHRLDARQMGVSVVRRLGLGLPSDHAGPYRHRGRQAPAPSYSVNLGTCTPTASCRRTNGTSATSIRQCRPGLPNGSMNSNDVRRAEAIENFSKKSSPNYCSTSRGGSTARTRAA